MRVITNRPPSPPLGNKTVVQLAEATPDLSTLVVALKFGGLVQTLSGKGPFTVFAPKNYGFQELPNWDSMGNWDPKTALQAGLLKPANKAELDAILTYHVIAGTLRAGDLTDKQELQTLNGNNTLIVKFRKGGDVFICDTKEQKITGNGPPAAVDQGQGCAQIITADVGASNGVVHVIDRVLLPGGPPKPPPFLGTCKQSGCYFATVTPFGLTPSGPFCGEVDAAPNMPDDIWNDTKAVAAYIQLTVDFWALNAPDSPRHTSGAASYLDLIQGRCGAQNECVRAGACGNTAFDYRGWTIPGGNTTIQWTRFDVMEAVCSGGNSRFGPGCGCKYPKCPDVPDKPGLSRFCGLCGPKFNAPLEVKYFRCAGRLSQPVNPICTIE